MMNSAMQTDFDRRILLINRILIGLIVLITFVPLVYILIASFMDPTTLLAKGISFNPKDWTIQGYQRVFSDSSIVDRKSTRLNSSHQIISYAVFCLKKKNETRKKVGPSATSRARTCANERESRK